MYQPVNSGLKQIEIDGRLIPFDTERSVLEIARKAGIDIPSFCYHSELSAHGACRLCMVEIPGRGITASCTLAPEPGLVVKTNTDAVRAVRKVALELLLANHDMNCPTCPRTGACRLQELARRLGIDRVRYHRVMEPQPLDLSNHALVRNPNRCILCGDCVKACQEIQGIGAIDIAFRGVNSRVTPAFGRDLAASECVYCGQCARVCPTGALTPRPQTDAVWRALNDPRTFVIAQIAPAVRVALGERFHLKPGPTMTWRIVSALRHIGFDRVFDTAFAADMTAIEESRELLHRLDHGGSLPMFTSCCPAWVRFAEQYYPELLPLLSSCRSPQQMFGAVARRYYEDPATRDHRQLVVVSIMPCTAKKEEARLEKYRRNGQPDVDHVITTEELADMIRGAGLSIERLEPGSFDLPMGFKTGAGLIFGSSGGVAEAVLRCLDADREPNEQANRAAFAALRENGPFREAEFRVGHRRLRVAVVHTLGQARRIAELVRTGDARWDLVEIMACPGGCVNGAGQPASTASSGDEQRTQGLRNLDTFLDFHRPQDNPEVNRFYRELVGNRYHVIGRELLHTHYAPRKRHWEITAPIVDAADPLARVTVCLGTACHLNGSRRLLGELMDYLGTSGLLRQVRVEATCCMEHCDAGPTVTIDGEIIHHATLETVADKLRSRLAERTDVSAPV
ncbi:MAG TPA: [FeFe] hydrogenase, group A [Candidatus Hydrogenedentes bacterium]|nr:[FeFe] hydrogenase, group A [Candidatus Hydrogenedentota bacterium]HPO30113.1 [FeFe] hydrogenase, group A [Candidatus Hydrogenedentota bacterium]